MEWLQGQHTATTRTHLERPAQTLKPLLLQLRPPQLLCLLLALLLQELHLLLQQLPLLHKV
jgi:hypothetical protein